MAQAKVRLFRFLLGWKKSGPASAQVPPSVTTVHFRVESTIPHYAVEPTIPHYRVPRSEPQYKKELT